MIKKLWVLTTDSDGIPTSRPYTSHDEAKRGASWYASTLPHTITEVELEVPDPPIKVGDKVRPKGEECSLEVLAIYSCPKFGDRAWVIGGYGPRTPWTTSLINLELAGGGE